MDRELFNQSRNRTRRRELRGDMPKAEQVLWHHLKGRQLDGYKFRRQHGVGPYIVDFFCPEVHLVVEVDGDSHFDPKGVEHDKNRDRYLREHDIIVLRFVNTEVYQAIDDVLDKIRAQLASNPLQLPLEKGEGNAPI